MALARDVEPPMPLVPPQTVWTLALNNQLAAPPAYDAKTAYFPIEFDRLAAYGIDSGKQRWIAASKPLRQPAACDDRVFVAQADGLVALNAADGSTSWTLPSTSPAVVPPACGHGWLVVALQNGIVLAIRGSDGHVVWQRDLGYPVHARPTITADVVYVPTDNARVIALALENGAPRWERRLGGAASEILARPERLFVGATDNFFYCLMAADGRIDWRWRTGGDVLGPAVADDRRVYFVALDNVIRGMDQRSGAQRWMRSLPLRPTAGPALAGPTVAVAGLSATIRTFNAADGAPQADINPGAEVAAAPHAFVHPVTTLPSLLVVTRDIVKGAAAVLITRSIDPAPVPVAPLPNAIMPAPTLPVQVP